MTETLTLVAGPVVEPITTTELARHLRLDDQTSPLIDEAELSEMIRAARQQVESMIGGSLITTTWKLTRDRFASVYRDASVGVTLPAFPPRSVTSITYVDGDGVTQTLDASDYVLTGANGKRPGVVFPANGKNWPWTRDVPEAVSIIFTAGFGDDPVDVPEPLRQAVRGYAATLYAQRESAWFANGQVVEAPHGWTDVIGQYRHREF